MRRYLSTNANSFDELYDLIRGDFLDDDMHDKVNTGHWQSLKGTPHSQTREIMHAVVEVRIARTPGSWAAYMQPNLPWAEDHFQERVCGEPLNPGEQYRFWPWYAGGVEDHKPEGQFSHTYMERYWPKDAGGHFNQGIRFPLGDLNDVVEQLRREPHTRQAVLPMYYAEDITAALQGERVPCSLDWHFMLRNDQLHCLYPMRSVDFTRYLRDDLYQAGRLVQWVIEKLGRSVPDEKEGTPAESLWDYVTPGKLLMVASSLHIFEGDVAKHRREHQEYAAS